MFKKGRITGKKKAMERKSTVVTIPDRKDDGGGALTGR